MAEKINANVPMAARKSVKEANRLLAELNARPGRPGFVPGSTAINAAQTPGVPETPPNLPNAVGELPPDARPVDLNAQRRPPDGAPPPADAQPVVQPDPVEQANHRYSVLQGKYEKETSRLLGAAQALRDENQRLLNELNTRQQAPAAALTREQTFDTGSVVTAQERTDYGDELLGIMAKIAKATSGAEVQRLEAELNRMRGQVQQAQQKAAEGTREKVWAALKAAVPNWETINISQEFVDWLADIDIISGATRGSGLHAAFEAGDASRVIKIFKRYIEEDSRSRSTSTPAPHTAQVRAETLIAPGEARGRTGEAPSGTTGGRIWSEQEINDFYSRVQRKRISPEEKASLEQEINAALREGRIQPARNDQHLSNRM